MALDNLITVVFTAAEIQTINDAIASINTTLNGKVVNLSPEERRQYGRIADRNKILVDKAKNYMELDPNIIPRTLDKAEFDADYIARQQLENPLRKLSRVMEKMQDTKTLLDHDNYNATIAFYRYVKYLAGQNEPGTTSVYQDLKKHYQNSGTSSDSESTSNDNSDK